MEAGKEGEKNISWLFYINTCVPLGSHPCICGQSANHTREGKEMEEQAFETIEENGHKIRILKSEKIIDIYEVKDKGKVFPTICNEVVTPRTYKSHAYCNLQMPHSHHDIIC